MKTVAELSKGSSKSPGSERRIAGLLFGVATHVLFAFTVWALFFFLRDGRPGQAGPGGLAVDFGLALAFAIPHSLLLWPPCAQRLKRWIIPHFYGCFYCVVTCVALLAMFSLWRGHAVIVWEATGWVRWSVQAAFLGSWVALFYSLSLTGLGYQTGFTPWWYWVRGQALPRREFVPRGAYHYLRHPVYLSFLGLIWFTPRMTLDHAILTGVWTIYIFFGSHLKDERLAYFLGTSYREYQARVPAYVGFVERLAGTVLGAFAKLWKMLEGRPSVPRGSREA